MQLMTLLHRFFEKELPSIHKIRLANVLSASATATKTCKLSLTGLGRELDNKNKTGSNIQKIDRLLSNKHLQEELMDFYKLFSSHLIKNHTAPWIHIDWSCINATTNLYLLRASLSMSGRAIVIYEECHPKKKENNHATHKAFLNHLKAILPASSKPIIVTDAGFRAPWFAYVRTLGWDFVGRLRNKNLVRLGHGDDWQLSKTLFERASGKPTYLGRGLLTKEAQVPAHFVLYKRLPKNRHKLTRNKTPSRSSKSKRYSTANKEPWLLVTSLSVTPDIAKQTVNIYQQRMRIEENFRDTKCPHYGLGLKKSLSRSPERMQVLLLIAAMATFAAWLAGIFISCTGRAFDFQAHSAKVTRALSTVYLGREAFKRRFSITKKQFNQTLLILQQWVRLNQIEPPSYEQIL